MTRVFIVEDNADDQEFLAESISSHPELELAGTAKTCGEAFEMLDHVHVDAIILDLVLPDGPGSAILPRTRELGIPTLVMTAIGDESSAAEIMANGASGYLLKDSDARSITDAITQMLDGGVPLSPRIARYLLDLIPPNRGGREATPALTATELSVLELIALGYTNKECAAELDRSTHTISTHLKNIYSKMHVNSRAQAVSRALACRLIDPETLARRPHDAGGL